jgi:hypothetical protein
MRPTLIEAHVPFPEFNAVFVSVVEFVCRLAACPWSTDAFRMRAARLRNDYGHYDDRNSQCQSIIAIELAVGVFIPS